MTVARAKTTTVGTALILFDGVCGLCNRTACFIIDHDPHFHFQFAPLQSPLARRILSPRTEAAHDLSTIVLIEGGRTYLRSTAALRILRHLSGPQSLISWLIVLPPPLRDGVYDWIARNRYGWFGKLESCRLPDAAVAGRFRFD